MKDKQRRRKEPQVVINNYNAPISAQNNITGENSEIGQHLYGSSQASSGEQENYTQHGQSKQTNKLPVTNLIAQKNWMGARKKNLLLFSGLLVVTFLAIFGLIIANLNRALQGTTTPTKGATVTLVPQNNKASATATAHIQGTTPTNSDHVYPTYLSGHGSFSLFDSFSQSDASWNNPSDNNLGNVCRTADGAFHVTEAHQGNTFHCYGPSFSDFAFEVQMTIVQGDCGGITFRGKLSATSFYQFDVCLDDSDPVSLFPVKNGTYGQEIDPLGGTTPNIVLSLNHPILLAVVAQGSTIKLFINRQLIGNYQDSSYTQGALALTARDDYSTQTEVIYSNATVWTF